MSGAYRNLKTHSSQSKTSLRPNSANSRNSNLTIQIQKREKLKSLLIEKFIKKFSAKEYKNLIQTEVSDFITKEKLTENDLKNFESHLSQLIQQDKNQNFKLNFDNYSNVSEMENKKAEKLTENENKYTNKKENYNVNLTDIDKKSTYTVSTLNSKNQNKNNVYKNENNFQIKIDKDKNAFLKTTTNKNSEKISFEKSNKLIINKNNPTILKNKNDNEYNYNKNNIQKNNNNEQNTFINQKDNNIKNKNLENSQKDQKSNKFQTSNYVDLEDKLSIKANSRPLSVKNLDSKNLKLEREESPEEESIDFDVEDIKNFELKKLFKDEKKPLERVNFDIESDEWQAIDNYKKNLHKNKIEESKRIDKEIKMKNKQAFDKQLKEKAIIKDQNKIQDMYHHEKVMNNVEKMYIAEMIKFKETEEKKIKEKEFREMQIKESLINKKKNYLENLKNDKKLCRKILYKLNYVS